MTELERAMVDAAIRSSPLGIAVLDPELRFVEVNDVMARVNGLPREAHLGRRMDQILPDMPTYLVDAMRSVARSGVARRVEYTGLLGQLGGPMTWVFELNPIPGPGPRPVGVCAVGIDVSERKRLEVAEISARHRVERMLASLASLQELTLALSPAMTTGDVARVLFERGGRVLGAAAAALFRYHDDTREVELLHGWNLPASDLGERRHPLDERLPAHDVVRTGEAFWIERGRDVDARWPHLAAARARSGTGAWAAVPLTLDGRVVGVIGMAFEGDRAIEAEDRAWLQAAAQQATQALERAYLFEERERLLGLVGHDLRSPLGAITASAGLLKKIDEVGPRGHRAIDRILSSAARMDRITRDLLDYTEVRVGRTLSLTRGPADLDVIARRVADEATVLHPDRRVAIEGLGDGGGSWDAERIGQALSNLVENAHRYGQADAPVRLAWDGRGEAVTLQVENRGVAIPADDLPHLFEAFWRGGRSRSQRGLGLGLFITREIVRAHGGQIAVRSGPEGTAFTLVLPRA